MIVNAARESACATSAPVTMLTLLA